MDAFMIFRRRIVAWGKENSRVFPWRNTQDPYAILVAEILLQHTAAIQVAKVFPRFMQEFPSIRDLNKASLSRVRKVIQPLGKHHRATDLKHTARIIVEKHNGNVPDNMKDLLDLPGVGRYSASATLNAAYGRNLPVVDSTINRVFSRYFLTDWSLEEVKKSPKPWHFARSVIPKKKTHQFNLYLLDFAALICTNTRPKCHVCILSNCCQSRQDSGKLPRN